MRELKFRAWDEYEKKMWYSKDNGTAFKDRRGEEYTFYMWFNEKTGEMQAITESMPFVVTDDPYTMYDTDKRFHEALMQYIGELDKNTNEIYESDIVKLQSGSIGVVVYRECCFTIDMKKEGGEFEFYEWPSEYFIQCEVLGNIYEHPHLLETKS